MKNQLLWGAESLPILINMLQSDNVILSTTDTILGLLALCTQKGFDRLNGIKGRQEKPYIVLVPDYERARACVSQQCHSRLHVLAQACWPGPVTLIFPINQSVPLYMRSAQGTIGLRVPDHVGLYTLLQHIAPLFSTSANRAGEPVPSQVASVNPSLIQQVSSIVLDDDLGQELSTKASTILDCSGDEVVLIREGAFPVDLIEQKAHITIKR